MNNETIRSLEDIVAELVDIEMTEGCHDDSIKDYKNELEFYLSGAERESYVNSYLPLFLTEDEQSIYDLGEIQYMVIEGIKEKV